ncbi:MAG: MBL fold metallo-hydrolase [Clostridiales bacterium]|jgi:glyoxylase-like metal-dependent hydrolase (beta-lactamase superfamily II)|nr:MBL fold metallo-hydrolase [Clostridiales bacterium]
MRIAYNAEMLEINGIEGAIYPVLTWDDEHLVLIDSGFPGQTDTIVRAISAVGFSPERITHIIITHQDMDHIGCVLDFLKLSPAALVLAHQDEAPYLAGDKTPIKLAAMLEQYDTLSDEVKDWCDNFKEGYATRKITVSQALLDKDVLPICGGIEVIHTPGHTPGHICLFLQESGIWVAGDALNIKDGELTGPDPQHTYDLGSALRSAEKVRAYPINAVIAYHSGYLEMKQ